MSSTTQADLLTPVKNWIKLKRPEVSELGLELDLIENRLIDSLDFIELIFLLEDLTGVEVDMNSLSIDSFRSLNAIRQNFFDL